MSSKPEVFIPLFSFDESQLVITDPEETTFNDITNWNIKAYYLDENGKECEMLIEHPPQSCFGVSAKYPMGTKEEDKNDSIIEGWQVMYPSRSLQTFEKPKKEEIYIEEVYNAIQEAILKKLLDPEVMANLPASIQNMFKFSSDDGTFGKNPEKGYRPFFQHPNKDEVIKSGKKKVPDVTKPKRAYIDLAFNKKKDKKDPNPPTIKSSCYAPGNKKVNAIVYRDKRGVISPVVRVTGAWLGQHGQTAYGAHTKAKIDQFNFVPQVSSDVSTKRYTRPNTAVEADDEEDEEVKTPKVQARNDDDGDEDEKSDKEEDDEEETPPKKNPLDALKSIAKKNEAKAKPAAKPKATAKPVAVAKTAPKAAVKSSAAPAKPKVAAKTSAPAKPKASAPAKPKAAAKPKPKPKVVEEEEDVPLLDSQEDEVEVDDE